jgi:iron(III) transport system permease protein
LTSLLPTPPSALLGGRREASRFSPAGGGFGPRWLRPARLGMPIFWLILFLFILLPCACFLVLCLSPRLFDQGSQWFTLTYLQQALNSSNAVAIVNSLWVSSTAAVIGVLLGFPVAWLAARTTMPGRRWVSGGMWLALLLPSWLPAIGWERLVQQDGVMYRIGLDWPWVTHLIMGPFGVVLLLGLRCVPFSYLAISGALNGLGQEFEDAARVHGASAWRTMRLIVPILAPAVMSALAIGFAESISDFGVAATLAYQSNFTLGTYALYAAIENFPPSFPLAAGMSWLLVAAVSVPLFLQARALRGRSYAILSGRTRQAVRRRLSRWEAVAAGSGLAFFFLVILGIPAFGAVSASLLADYGASFSLSWANYTALFQQPGLIGPLERSMIYGVIVAFVTVFLGFIVARMLSQRRTAATGAMDYMLLASVALPGVVFGAGYIFAYNLPIMSTLHINLYQTVQLLIIAYIASSLPTNARVLVGSVSQIQGSLQDAARAHGAGAIGAWARGVLPVLSRPIMMAWLYTFCGVFLELPLSQLLYAPGSPPASIAIEDNLSNYHYGIGMAQAVLAVAIAFGVVAVVLGGYRLLAPRGWRRIGQTTRG